MVDTQHQLTLYINDACSKGCSFCFIPDEVKAIDREMDIPMLERLIDEVGATHFQIQGGEPTEHLQFKEIMHMFARKNVTFHMLSALLFSESMCDTIIHHINAGTCLAIHPNCAELDEVWGKEDKTRLERWKRNYLRIYEAMFKRTSGYYAFRGDATQWAHNNLSLCYTIPQNLRKNKSKNCVEYLDWLRKQIPDQFHMIRIGLDLNGTYLLHNYEVGDILDSIHELAQKANFGFFMDCQVPHCINRPGEARPWHYDQTGMQGCITCTDSKGIEVMPDGSVVHCFQSQGEIGMPNVIPNIFDFDYAKGDKWPQLRAEHTRRYVETYNKIGAPETCQQCPHFQVDCNGLCLGCLAQQHETDKANKIEVTIA